MSEFNTQQLATARAAAWHQNGEPLLTMESLREWLHGYGLVLFAPRPQQISAPAPTLVEAVLGAAYAAPTAAEMEPARGLLARLVAEGAAVPLNLLGGASDVPDYVVSSKLFSFVFTLRGDKGWKQPPVTTGAVRVSPLAVNAYALLAERDMTLAELVHELGREVTEAAVLRALCDLWGHLRVLPAPGVEGAESKWEPATRRLTKQIKAGINAGVPSALSGLISVYLAQAIAASEEEVEVFLSPVMARSRIREVLHALLAGQQLETVVLEGKTLLHVAGELPEFAPEAVIAEAVAAENSGEAVAAEGASTEAATAPASRIRKFAGARPERERRPFQREGAAGGSAKLSFTKPWDEERRERPAATEGEAAGAAPKFRKKAEGGWKPTRSFSDRPKFGSGEGRPPRRDSEDKPAFRPRPNGDGDSRPSRKSFGGKPKFGAGPRKSFGDRPFRPRAEGEAGPPRKSYGDRPKFDGPRKSFGGGDRADRPRRTFGDKPSFGGKPGFGGGDRPPRKSFGDKPFRPRAAEGEGRPARKPFDDRPRKPFGDRPKFDGPRKSFGGGDRGERPRRTFGDKPSFGGEGRPPRKTFGDKPFRPRPSGDGEGRPPRKEYGDRPAKPFSDRPKFDGPRKSFGDKPFRPRPSSDGEGRPPRKSFGDKPAGGFGAKKFGDKPGGGFAGKPRFGAKPAGKFGAKPAGKFGGKPGGGFGGKKFGAKPAGKFGGKPKFAGKGKPTGAKRAKPRKEGDGGGEA